MIDTYAVMGNPVAHSKSPIIHTEFAKQTHQSLRYLKIEVPLDKFKEYVGLFAMENGKGLNITAPFKQQAFDLVSMCTPRASVAKSVNTIKFLETGQMLGDNTDGIGFIRDVTVRHGYSIFQKRVLILGAGGATRGILQPILEQDPKFIILANRTLLTAKHLVHDFGRSGNIFATDLMAIEGDFDFIVNATSWGLNNTHIPFSRSILSKSTFCYDLMYGQNPTPFLKWAVSKGASQIADGLGMLVEQAAESFYIWRGIKPDTQKIITMLENTRDSVH